MKEPKVLIFDNSEKLVEAFTHHFMSLMSLTEGDFHVALSGGSTPKIWFEKLVKNYKDDIEWNKVHFYWGDERCVPPDDEDSNYGMAKKYLLDHINIPEQNVHRILGELIPEEAAELYERELFETLLQKSVPIFDLVILGLGDDGHTASIFPHQIELWDSEKYCVVATHPDSGQRRISLTGKVINCARSVAFLVTGNKKADKVIEILYKKEGSVSYPASHVSSEKSNLYWFLDKPAASHFSE
jgi:6-phosphogluconolactonase